MTSTDAGNAASCRVNWRAALTDESVTRGEIDLRQRLVVQELQRHVVHFEVLPDLREIGADVERPPDGRCHIDRFGREFRPIGRIDAWRSSWDPACR